MPTMGHALAWGVVVGGIAQFLWLLASCRREGVWLRLPRPRLTAEVRRLLRRALPVAFGAGVHTCLGAALARLETQVAVGALLRRWPTLRLASDRTAWRPTATLLGLATLPVTW